MYIRYLYHQNMFFEHFDPSLRLLKIWGILAWFGDIWDGVLLCKCHNLKNICEIDKKRSWFYHFRHEGTIWAKNNWIICTSSHILRPLWYLKKEWTNIFIFLFSNPPSLLIIFSLNKNRAPPLPPPPLFIDFLKAYHRLHQPHCYVGSVSDVSAQRARIYVFCIHIVDSASKSGPRSQDSVPFTRAHSLKRKPLSLEPRASQKTRSQEPVPLQENLQSLHFGKTRPSDPKPPPIKVNGYNLQGCHCPGNQHQRVQKARASASEPCASARIL